MNLKDELPYVLGVIENVRRNLKNTLALLDIEDRDSQLIDLINHTDTQVVEIQNILSKEDKQ